MPSSVLPPDLRERARRLATTGSRRILGLAGAPGSGKSTLAAVLAAVLGPDAAVVVPMDGFHLAQSELERLGRAGRKGAPDTFDAAGFVALLRRLREQDGNEVVYAPSFRRELEEPVAGAIAVAAAVPLVIVEGNYLLCDDGFAPVRGLLDQSWFLAPPEPERLRWLLDRHVLFGRTEAAARDWIERTDAPNARVILSGADRADLVVGTLPEATAAGTVA